MYKYDVKIKVFFFTQLKVTVQLAAPDLNFYTNRDLSSIKNTLEKTKKILPGDIQQAARSNLLEARFSLKEK